MEKGITLVLLTITIIVMTIFSAILISSTGGLDDAEELVDIAEDEYEGNKAEVERSIESIEEKWGNIIHKNTIDNEFNY